MMSSDAVRFVRHSEDLGHALTLPRDGPLSRESWSVARRPPYADLLLQGDARRSTAPEVPGRDRGADLHHGDGDESLRLLPRPDRGAYPGGVSFPIPQSGATGHVQGNR